MLFLNVNNVKYEQESNDLVAGGRSVADFICFGRDGRPDRRAERSDEKGDPGRRDRARRGEERSLNAGAVPASRI